MKGTRSKLCSTNFFPYICSFPFRVVSAGGLVTHIPPKNNQHTKKLRSGNDVVVVVMVVVVVAVVVVVCCTHLGSETVRLVKRRNGSSRPLPCEVGEGLRDSFPKQTQLNCLLCFLVAHVLLGGKFVCSRASRKSIWDLDNGSFYPVAWCCFWLLFGTTNSLEKTVGLWSQKPKPPNGKS